MQECGLWTGSAGPCEAWGPGWCLLLLGMHVPRVQVLHQVPCPASHKVGRRIGQEVLLHHLWRAPTSQDRSEALTPGPGL